MNKQFEALLAHHARAIPLLGPAPQHFVANWKSLLTADGTPIEYCWKWNTKTTNPSVRYTVEAIDQTTGSEYDPLNHRPAQQLLHGLRDVLPGLDVTWFNHFQSTLYDKDVVKYAREVALGAVETPLTTTLSVALEFVSKGIFTKTYFTPRKLGQSTLMPLSEWETAIRQIQRHNVALDALMTFLGRSTEGQKLKPFMLAIDNIDPSKSRIKLYFQTSSTNFDSVREIMTLGGLVMGMDRPIDDVVKFIRYASGLSSDHPADKDIPPVHSHFPIIADGYIYYFDIAPHAVFPEVKILTPVYRWGKDDHSIAMGICTWMQEMGRGQYCDNYMHILGAMTEDLNTSRGLHTFLGCLCKKDGQVDVTSYLNPNVYGMGAH